MPEKTGQSAGHEAVQTPGGSWIIRGVPIFAAHVDDRGAEPVEFSSAWLQSALSIAKTRESEGYLPPLHIGHHGDEKGVEGVGKFRMTHVGQINHGGKTVPAIFADLIVTDQDSYKRIKKGELSFRSVEILDVDSKEIDSLALLDDEVPFFRFPLLKISKETASSYKKLGPVLAYSAAGKSRSILLNFGAENMPPETEETGSAPADALMKIMAVLTAIATKLGVGGEQAEAEEKEMPEEPPAQKDAGPVEVQKTVDEAPVVSDPTQPGTNVNLNFAQAGELAGILAYVKQLENRVASMEKADKVKTAAFALQTEGFDEDDVNEYRTIANKHGLQAAQLWAQGYKRRVGSSNQEPPRSWGGEVRADAPDATEVAAYAQFGAEALDKARSLARSYSKTRPDMPLKDYLEAVMDPTAHMTASLNGANKRD